MYISKKHVFHSNKMQTAIKKNRLPVETIKDKVSVRNSNINKRDHFFDDRLF
jgi:hypothetical protein